MPNWRFHLSVGAVLTVFLIYFFYYSSYWYLFVYNGQIQYLFCLHVLFVSLLGSLLPDFDERRTKIRRIIGLVLGGFIIVSIILIDPKNFTLSNLPGFVVIVIGLFVLFLIISYVIPFKHHGVLHSVSAAVVYMFCWLLIELLVFKLPVLQAIIISIFAFAGFMLHLILDKDLKWM